jgi:hypothetical protein
MTNASGSRRRKGLRARLWEELTSFFWIFLYLFIAFGFFTLADKVVHREEGVSYAAHGFAAINALVFGKIMLIGEQMGFARWFRRAPLAYIIAWQSFVFTLLLIAAHFLEHAVIAYFRHGSPQISLDLGGGGWLGLGLVALMMFFALVPFFTYRNLAAAIGPEYLHTLLFRTRGLE